MYTSRERKRGLNSLYDIWRFNGFKVRSEALAQRTAVATSLLAKGALWQPEEAIDELGQTMRPPRWMMDCGLFT